MSRKITLYLSAKEIDVTVSDAVFEDLCYADVDTFEAILCSLVDTKDIEVKLLGFKIMDTLIGEAVPAPEIDNIQGSDGFGEVKRYGVIDCINFNFPGYTLEELEEAAEYCNDNEVDFYDWSGDLAILPKVLNALIAEIKNR